MPPAVSDIDRLIEEGLDHYGSGDLDNALLSWEQALAIDPENEQALSYVDYVRMNYELLSESVAALDDHDDTAFALNEEPEYSIEIVPGELVEAEPTPMYMDPTDGGWMMDDEVAANGVRVSGGGSTADKTELSEFETATREYGSERMQADSVAFEATVSEFSDEEGTPPFPTEGTPVGFATETTELKKRDLGFVQPAGDVPPTGVVEREVIRDAPSAAVRAAAMIGRAPTTQHDSATAEALQLEVSKVDQTAELPVVRIRTPSKPPNTFPRAASEPYAELELAPLVSAPTLELGLRNQRPVTASDDVPTRESDVTAFRAQAAEQPPARATTGGRAATELGIGVSSPRAKTERLGRAATSTDPIEARKAQILEQVEIDAPAEERLEDRTRRRINALLEHALAYDGIGDHERAVAAVERALGEDPDSALAQKLIHRNRDTILGVFQTYLGDLERQPHLVRPLSELAGTPISPRAAFLLSRVDGMLTLDEILDVSGMPRMEAYRYLCQLFLHGILK